jgi:hypothetical protein
MIVCCLPAPRPSGAVSSISVNTIQLAKSTPAGLSRRFNYLRSKPDRDPHSLLLVACGLLYLTCRRPDERPAEPLIIGFEYSANPGASAIRVAYVTTDGGECFIDQQVQVLLACSYGQFTLHTMLSCGAKDHLDHHYSYWNKENGTRGLLVFGIHVDGQGRLSVETRGRTNLGSKQPCPSGQSNGSDKSHSNSAMTIHRSAFDKLEVSELSATYCRDLQNEIEPARSILTVASALLLKAAAEILPTRECAAVTFEFEGDSEATRVEIIGIEDTKGFTISEGTFLITWKPTGDRTIGSFLGEAISRYLDQVIPEWRKAPGAEGYVNLSISWSDAGELVAVATGRAKIWTRTDRLLPAS